ncbi:MAG: LPD25 domain-containing protein [Faecousia sp.]
MSYSSYDHDNLETAETMKIERRIYFESEKSDLSGLAALPLSELLSMRSESAAAEQAVFDRLKEQAAAWEEQAGKTLSLDKAIEYARTPPAKHTSNQWEAPDSYRHVRSNAVYQMSYSISENTRYDSKAQKSIPYSWTLRWSIYTNAPGTYGQAKIAGQERKVFASREELDKYLNGRIKAHQHLFTEISPPIPKEYADYFKVNGLLLPGYTIEGEEPKQAAELPKQEEPQAEQPEQPPAQPQAAPVPERREPVSEVFSIMIDNRTEAQNDGPHGYWLDLPTTAEKLQEAMREIHISADNPQDFFIAGFSYPEDRRLAIPYDMVLAADVDELNFLAARLDTLDAAALAELNAALQNPRGGFENIGQIIDYADNVDYFVHLPDVQSPGQLGDYYLNRSGMVDMPEEWKAGIDVARFGQHIAQQEQGVFTPYGYLVRSGDEWQRIHEGQPVPEEYRVMGFPQPEVLREAVQTQQAAAPTAEAPAQPQVIPIILNSKNSADRMKEITDKLETGIMDLFESDRFQAYLDTMARFHNYSFNNTILIAMQGGQLVAGYNKWRDEFHRNVKKGEKGIKIFAPAPYKVKKEVPKLDEQGQPVKDKDGNTVTEQKEIQVPAFKIVSVFDVSQTEGEPLPSLGVEELTGDVERYQDFFKALEQTSPVPMAFEDIPGGSHGYYHLTEKRIAIQENMSELQTLKTAIHEIAHAKLHAIDPEAPAAEQQNRPDSRTREVQAESVAYTVCQHYGLDTSDYSFGYVAGWSSGKDLKELKASLETIRATAHELITTIDGHLAELQQQRQAQQEQAPAQEQPQAEEPAAAFIPETVYQVRPNPYHENGGERYLLQAYVTQENGMAKMGDILYRGSEEQCRALMGRLQSGELTADQVKDLYAQQAAEQPAQDSVFSKLPPEQQQEMADSVKAMLQTLIDADVKSTGEVTQGTLDAIQTQGFVLSDDGTLQRAGASHTPEPQAEEPALDPAAEPVVTILFSESPHLETGQQMPLHEADALFAKLDAEHPGGGYYDKTDFRIDFTFQGEAHSYSGRQDFGDRDGSLIEHIRGYQEFYLHDEQWKNHVLKYRGPEALAEDQASREAFISEIIPYMELHCNLSRLEQEAQTRLASGDTLTPEETAYYEALADYVKECRPLLNQGEPLPEMPQLSDFDPSIEAYREQVMAEIEQEAADAGMTVEEYAAAGYEAPAQEAAPEPGDTFSIYQVPAGPEGRDFRYRPYEELQAAGLTVDRKNYELVYTAPLEPGTTLADIDRRFQMDHPADYKGRSLSTGDVVVFQQGDKQAAYYVDAGAGYREVPEFFNPQEKQLTPDASLTGERIQTPRGSFYVTAMSREQIEAAGYGFHHQSEDGKYLIMGNGTQAYAIPAQQESPIKTAEMSTEQNYNMIDGVLNNAPSMGELEAKAEDKKPKQTRPVSKTAQRQKKPSIRAQLKAAKKEQAKKPPQREKSKELEV